MAENQYMIKIDFLAHKSDNFDYLTVRRGEEEQKVKGKKEQVNKEG
jgi:hypothetical protein